MNDIHKEPLFTSWPNPFSEKNMKECFSVKQKKQSSDRRKKTSAFNFLLTHLRLGVYNA